MTAASATPADPDLAEIFVPVPKDDAIADDPATIELSRSELREVARYAVACARPALAIFERERPDDRRPRTALDAAQAFAAGAERTKALRDRAWAAHRAAQEAREAGQAAASDAARAAGHAVGAAFLHPLANATQVTHLLGSAAHAARAFELAAGDDPTVGAGHLAQARLRAPPVVVDVLRRYPVAPRGGGRVGELIRQLDASLRCSPTGCCWTSSVDHEPRRYRHPATFTIGESGVWHRYARWDGGPDGAPRWGGEGEGEAAAG
jgi:hypothetical protein